MRPRSVRTTTFGLAGLLVAACALFAGLARDSWRAPAAGRLAGGADGGAKDGGREAFEARCGGCHAPEDLAPALRAAPDADAARDGLVTFLAGHADLPAPEAGAIAAFLRGAEGGAPRDR